MKLPTRLLAIVRMIPKGKIVADIGTDHAILPVYLVSNGLSAESIATDLNQGPLEAAAKTVTMACLNDKIKIRLGYGLKTISSGEADVAVIAGMGGGTIKRILEDCNSNVPVNELVMQPMGDSAQLRIWLVNNGWKINDEDIVEEDGRYYEIISAIRGFEKTSDADIVGIGPRLFEKKHPLLVKLLEAEIKINERIIQSLDKSEGNDSKQKRKEFIMRNQRLEWIIKCLLNAKQ